MSGWAAQHPLDHQPATYWEYLSASTNILAAVVRAAVRDRPGLRRLRVRPAVRADRPHHRDARHGRVRHLGRVVVPVGQHRRLGATRAAHARRRGRGREAGGPRRLVGAGPAPAMPTGEGHGYGAQTWIPGEPDGGECASTPGYPADALTMEGHYGQVVAMIPSKKAVIVRLGWSVIPDFDGCAFVADVAKTLPSAS